MNRIHRMSPWIVGYSGGTGGPYSFYAFITGPDGEGMMDLNSLVDSSQRVILIQATDIDNAGQAIAIVLTLQPETYALTLSGLGFIRFMVQRKKSENRM